MIVSFPANGGWEASWNIPGGVASGIYFYVARVRFEPTGEQKKEARKFAVVK